MKKWVFKENNKAYVNSLSSEYESGEYKISEITPKCVTLENKIMPRFKTDDGVSEIGPLVMLYPCYQDFLNEQLRLHLIDEICTFLNKQFIRDNITMEQLSAIKAILEGTKEFSNSRIGESNDGNVQ